MHMQINLANLKPNEVESLRKLAQDGLDRRKSYVDLRGEKVTVPKDAKLNIVVSKNGAVIPLMWDKDSGKFQAVFNKDKVPEGISASDIKAAAASFAKGTSGNVVIASEDVKVNSNNCLVIESDGTKLTASDNSSVIKSPHSTLIECMYGIIDKSPEFFGWFSHWIHTENSMKGQIHNSDNRPGVKNMVNSPEAMIDACEFATCKDSSGAQLRQSSYLQVTNSPKAIAYEVNRGKISDSKALVAAFCNGLIAKNSANNGVLHSSNSKLIDSPNLKGKTGKYATAFKKHFQFMLDRKSSHKKLLKEDDKMGEAFELAALAALRKANIRYSSKANVQGSHTVTLDTSLEPKVHNSSDVSIVYADSVEVKNGSHGTKVETCSELVVDNSPGVSVTDSTGSEVTRSPEVILNNSMNLKVTDAKPGTEFINKSSDLGEGDKESKTYDNRLAAALKASLAT